MAITFDAASSNPPTTDPSSATTNTWAHTVGSGSNRLLWVGSMSENVTSVTYNGVSMTQGAIRTTYDDTALYYLAAPSTGVNNVVITRSNSGAIWGAAASYTGAAQTGIVNVSGTNSGTGLSSITATATTTVDNCWGVTAAFLNNRNIAGGTNATARAKAGSGGGIFNICDTNAPQTPAGSYSMTVTASSGSAGAIAMVFFPPAASSTTIKTWNGIPIANIKTINGIAIANIKTINGIA